MKSGGSGGRSKKSKAKCADFEGLWKGINPEDYSNILASITCDDEDTATVVGNDSKWGEPVCGDTPLQAGGYTKVYELVEGILSDKDVVGTGGIFDITCEDGTELTLDTENESGYALLPNGSLSFNGFAVLWKQNSD